MPPRFHIETIAVLGAGYQGTQIAAHFVNAGMKTFLFDLPATESDKNALIHQAITALNFLDPRPIGKMDDIQYILPANYEEDLAKIKDCDLVIETIPERMAWKKSLYTKISPFLGEHSVVVSNTTGLCLNELASAFPKAQQSRFCGMHFFNPPRYRPLVELIPQAKTDPALLEGLETFLVSYLGKNIIYAKNTPNFIVNRLGVFSLLSTLKHAEFFGFPPDKVDALTGPLIGRSEQATYRSLDVMGLDTFANMVNTMTQSLALDPWYSVYQVPEWVTALIQKGILGKKTKMGIYKEEKGVVQVLDIRQGEYRPVNQKLPPEILKIFAIQAPNQRFTALQASSLPEAKFLLACFRDLFHYAAYHLAQIAVSTRDIDLAFRLAFDWEQGPFELWQSLGWQDIVIWLKQAIASNKTLANAKLPDWASEQVLGPYKAQTAFSPDKKSYVTRSNLAVYRRQLFPLQVLGENQNEGNTIFETDAVRLWTARDDIAILNFKTPKNRITLDVLEGIQQAIFKAEQAFLGLVLWQRWGQDFSLGADLKMILASLHSKNMEQVATIFAAFQQTAQALRYAKIPSVAAVRGFVLGGACELMMHCTRSVAAFETYMGLVEVGLGLLPAGTGSKEMAFRAAKQATTGDAFPFVASYFNNITQGSVSNNALEAKQLGYLKETDTILMNPLEILYVAKQQVLALNIANYCPPRPEKIAVLGRSGLKVLENNLDQRQAAGEISVHDHMISTHLARVMCGGDIDCGTPVSEEWFLALEHQACMALLQTKKTQDRIAYMLEHGAALKN